MESHAAGVDPRSPRRAAACLALYALTKAVIAKVMAAAAAKMDRIVMGVFMVVSFPWRVLQDALTLQLGSSFFYSTRENVCCAARISGVVKQKFGVSALL
jgi:hypothetical protein